MKQKMTVTVKGKRNEYCFTVEADDKYLEEWRADGVEIYVLANTIPYWVAELRLIRPWVFAQDCWQKIRLW